MKHKNPCIDCLTYPICKQKIINRYKESIEKYYNEVMKHISDDLEIPRLITITVIADHIMSITCTDMAEVIFTIRKGIDDIDTDIGKLTYTYKVWEYIDNIFDIGFEIAKFQRQRFTK
jgi:hypothetical protein